MLVLSQTGVLGIALLLWIQATRIFFQHTEILKWKECTFFMALIFLGAPLAETIYNELHYAIHGVKLWEYVLYPIGGGNTSLLAVVGWPLYGLNLYFIYKKLDTINNPFWKSWVGRGAVMALEGPVWEIVANLTFLIFFKTYIFYYFPGDVWHLNSFQVMPVYATCGVLGYFVYKYLKPFISWRLNAVITSLGFISLSVIYFLG